MSEGYVLRPFSKVQPAVTLFGIGLDDEGEMIIPNMNSLMDCAAMNPEVTGFDWNQARREWQPRTLSDSPAPSPAEAESDRGKP